MFRVGPARACLKQAGVQNRGHKFVRYADDFLALVKSERTGQRVMASLTRFLMRKLRLAVNPVKSKVAKLNPVQLSGIHVPGQEDRLVG